MLNFNFYNPTQICFGAGQIEKLGALVKAYADKILLLYGKSSIKKNGIYDAVAAQLQAQGIEWVELAGVDPNPRITTVREGARLCREHGLGFVLAVGGGSVIDCAKGIAAATLYDGDAWDFWTYKVRPERALPLGALLTLAATGSEMNDGTVVSNLDAEEKRGMSNPTLFPKFSILDPTYTYSVSPYQTAAGTADIMTHVYEFYFGQVRGAYVQDSIAEAVLKTCVKYGPIAYADPEHYEARANLMWASSIALNGIIGRGKVFDGFCHISEHAISALYDLTHGVGLAILATHWMEYILDETTAWRLAEFARNVWGIASADDFDAARQGIAALRAFYRSLELPLHLSEVGIGDERFDELVAKTVYGETVGQFKKLTAADVRAIFERAK